MSVEIPPYLSAKPAQEEYVAWVQASRARRQARKAAQASGTPSQPSKPSEPTARELYRRRFAEEQRELGSDLPGE